MAVLSINLIELLEWVLGTLLARSSLVLVGMVAERPVFAQALHTSLLSEAPLLVVSLLPLTVLEELPVEFGNWLHLLKLYSKLLLL